MGIRGQSLGAVHHYVATVYILVEDQDWTSKLTAESCDAVVSDMSPQRHTTATRTHSGRSAPVAAAGHSPGAYTCWKRSICACTWILRCGRDGYIRMPMHRCLGTVVVCATRRVLRRRTWWDESVSRRTWLQARQGRECRQAVWLSPFVQSPVFFVSLQE